ncbi:MAG: hypothetical protein IGR92_00685 [Leptolyngbyaceae cyanobacterium T60_A2020_046]|nr:hypothetical protein [Leptolyngbyaceae cyanobacterium T60_A2020_046]
MKIRRTYGVLWAFAVGLVLMASVLPTVDKGQETVQVPVQKSVEVPLARRDRARTAMPTSQVPRSPFHGDR